MKPLIFILFLFFFSNKGYSQFQLKQIDDNNEEILVNYDNFLLIPFCKLDSIIKSQLEIPQNADLIDDYGCSGCLYLSYLVKKNELIESKKIRGVAEIFDTIIQLQNKKLFDIIKANLVLDSNKSYSIIIPLSYKHEGINDSIYLSDCHGYNKSSCNYTINHGSIRFYPYKLIDYSIPKDINECITQIDILFDSISKSKIIAWKEDYFSRRMHSLIGIWIRNYWKLWGKSILSDYFNSLGIYHPDDMSDIVITSYYRYLKGSNIKLEKQIKKHRDYWENIFKKSFEEINLGDTVIYTYRLGFVSKKQKKDFVSQKCIAKGEVILKDEKKMLLKVKLIDCCDKQGVYYLDIEKYETLKSTKISDRKLKKEVITKIRIGTENWFYKSFWDKSQNLLN